MLSNYKLNALSAVISAAITLPALAAGSYELEEVVVTATKRTTSLQDTPLAISAFDERVLKENHVTNIYDLRGMAPSLQIRSNGDHGVPLIFIRGQGTIDQTEAGDQSVAFYTDGVFSARSQGSTAMMYDMERVEVLRGPQGTLFGRNSTAGAVSLITAKPKDEFEANVSVLLGSRDRHELRFMLNTPVTDNWALRFAGVSDEQDGETDIVSPSPFAGEDNYGTKDMLSYRLGSMFTPNENISWFLSYEKFKNQGTGDVTTPDGEDRENVATAPGELDLDVDSFRTRFDYTFSNDMMFSYIGGYTDMSQTQLYGNEAQGDTRETVSSGHSATQHEIQLKNSDDKRFRWTAGLFWFEEENDIRFDMRHSSWGFTAADGPVTLSSFNQPDRTLESKSGYVQGTFDITENWRVTAGWRRTDDTRQDQGGRSIDCNYDHGTGPINIDYPSRAAADASGMSDICFYRQVNDMKDSWSNDTYLARLEWDVSDDIMLFLSYATGWKSGVLVDGRDANTDPSAGPLNTNDNPNIAANNSLIQQPEENDSFELGMKSSLLDGRMTLNANLFYMDYTDMQVTSAVIDPVTTESVLTKTNAGSATIQGLEFTMNFAMTENGVLTLTGSLLDATYDEYIGSETNFNSEAGLQWNDCGTGRDPAGGCVDGLWDFSGNTLPNAPEVMLSLAYKHDFILSSGATLTPRVRLTYQDDTYLTYENRGDRPAGSFSATDPGETDMDVQEAYTKIDASVGYTNQAGTWDLELYVNNLTDEQIKQELNIGPVETFVGWAPSREAGVRFSYNFD
ncbi:TonB-dependent receptor [Aestuariicella hydrocarbonica]|uniref:TonB-dependent receptor n=1 Tax=Pseudomaricurvus hydrocarbonicus TaxID=1470433 RepID=A0A9E5JXP2_9GAMM|nr:TonB-dependent receptor [Aestuariicella hydrocarbonica]NHO66450.1 TonB-dependent receptor [Aestuariicella hydrocarbonica]